MPVVEEEPFEIAEEEPFETVLEEPAAAVEEDIVPVDDEEPVEVVEKEQPSAVKRKPASWFFEEDPVDVEAPAPEPDEAVEAPPLVPEPEETLIDVALDDDAPVREEFVIDAVLLPSAGVMLEKAIRLAVEAHGGQVDKAGDPYILHPLRMMFQMKAPSEKIAAVLHDIVEDTGWTLDMLRREGFSEVVIEAVDNLTRRPDESYEAFIERAARNPIARRVKLADLEDNMDVRRLGKMTEKDQARLARYQDAWRKLRDYGF